MSNAADNDADRGSPVKSLLATAPHLWSPRVPERVCDEQGDKAHPFRGVEKSTIRRMVAQSADLPNGSRATVSTPHEKVSVPFLNPCIFTNRSLRLK